MSGPYSVGFYSCLTWISMLLQALHNPITAPSQLNPESWRTGSNPKQGVSQESHHKISPCAPTSPHYISELIPSLRLFWHILLIAHVHVSSRVSHHACKGSVHFRLMPWSLWSSALWALLSSELPVIAVIYINRVVFYLSTVSIYIYLSIFCYFSFELNGVDCCRYVCKEGRKY